MLSLAERPEEPVAFGVAHVAAEQMAGVFLGLDYEYGASHHSYQQVLLPYNSDVLAHLAESVHTA